MLHGSLVVLDFETTGLSPERGDRITEVGVVRVQDGLITDRYQSLVNCGIRVPSSISAYTGITQQMVDEAPPVAIVMRELAAFIGATPVVAHSAGFDQQFFQRECARLDLDGGGETFICSMQLARRLYPLLPSHSLAVLANSLALPTGGAAHRAAADAEMTAALMIRMGRDLAARYPGIELTAPLLRRLMQTALPVTDAPVALPPATRSRAFSAGAQLAF